MAKTRKKKTGETPRAFAGAPNVDTPSKPPSAPTIHEPDQPVDERDRIAARAYELYLERGGSGGNAMDDWLAAEQEFERRRQERGKGKE